MYISFYILEIISHQNNDSTSSSKLDNNDLLHSFQADAQHVLSFRTLGDISILESCEKTKTNETIWKMCVVGELFVHNFKQFFNDS